MFRCTFLNYFFNFSDVLLLLPAHDVSLDTSNNQSSHVQLHIPQIQIHSTNETFRISDHSNNLLSNVKLSLIPIPYTLASRYPTENPIANDHPTSLHTNPKNHLTNMGTSTTNNKHDTMNNILHPHRSSNYGYDKMQHHHLLSTREQNDKKFPSTWRKPYHNIMEIGENDDLILRLPFYFRIFFLNFIFVDSTLHNCLLKNILHVIRFFT